MIASLPPVQANAFKSTYDMILEEGIEIGIEKGRSEGIEIGVEKGIEKGRREMLIHNVRNMLKRYPEWSDETIAEVFGVDAQFVATLRAEG